MTPSFEQMGISIMNEIDDEESTCNLPVEYQLILSWCWLCIKVSNKSFITCLKIKTVHFLNKNIAIIKGIIVSLGYCPKE